MEGWAVEGLSAADRTTIIYNVNGKYLNDLVNVLKWSQGLLMDCRSVKACESQRFV